MSPQDTAPPARRHQRAATPACAITMSATSARIVGENPSFDARSPNGEEATAAQARRRAPRPPKMSRERSFGSQPASAMHRRGEQRDVPEQVARGAGVGALVDRPAVREQARQREQRQRQTDQRERRADRQPGQAAVAGRLRRGVQQVAHERGADDRRAPGTRGRRRWIARRRRRAERTRRPAPSPAHAPSSRKVTETDGRAVSSGDMSALRGVRAGRKSQTQAGVQTCACGPN